MKDIKDTKEIIPAFEVRTDPFGENVSGGHAYKRAERIVSALYLVTNHVRYDEPLRRQIRSIGHDLLTEVIALRGGFRASESGRINAIEGQIRECITLARLLQIAGYVSAQNVSILTHALDELGQFLEGAQHSTLSDGIQLERDDFIPADTFARTRAPSVRHAHAAPESAAASEGAQAREGERQPHTPGRAVQTEVHGERRTLIMDILKKSGPIGIKDISMQMVGCSEKTVQRELSVLIREQKIQKQGEKRWSTYSVL